MKTNPLSQLRIFYTTLLIMGIFSVLMVKSCSTETQNQCQFDIHTPCIPNGEPFERLSEYNLFKGRLPDLTPVDQLIPYDLNTPLFSDYSSKFRLVYVPEGTTIDYGDIGVLDFPVGSVLVKNFYYNLDEQSQSSDRHLLETRLLIRNSTEWRAETYVWNDEQTDAFRKRAGDLKEVNWIDSEGNSRHVNYLIPTVNDCRNCHSKNNKLIPLGPEIQNLNKQYLYNGTLENQLVYWEQAGILNGKPNVTEIPKAPVWDDPTTGTLEQRARIYLDVNCSNCHNVSGSANNTGLYLSYEENDLSKLGICKLPIAIGPGSGGLKFNIVPCRPGESILVYRMNSTKPATRMPEIGRTLVHEEGVQLIKEWIENMNCTSCQE